MCKYYKAPCLLIEFDPEKSFCLQNSNELGVEIRNDSICSKMALLTMHFPKLRILWSRSPHETLRIFSDLKANHEEVDVDKAVEIGRSESIEALLQPTIAGKGNADKDGDEDDDDGDEINEAARDMLLRLPGVNIHAARRIMEEVDSLAELAEMSRDELRRVAGPVAGQKLFTFFHQKMGSV
jgi:DNA excision repair protein ERCC-4